MTPTVKTGLPEGAKERYAAWFQELDAWTEYWDIYHPETRGRFYFGDGESEPGLLTCFLPRQGWPPPFVAWRRRALAVEGGPSFADEVCAPAVRAALIEVDDLVGRLFATHFGDAGDPGVRSDYLDAIFQFGIDVLPPATSRDALIADDDFRKRTAGRHALDGDIMWFGWALQLEGAEIVGPGAGHARRTLMLAGVAIGCAANFAWRGHRRTRPEYVAGPDTAALLRQRGLQWATDFQAAAGEVHSLFRIREWGSEN